MNNTKEKEIKLLIVDDSAFMRQLIKDLLNSYKNIRVDTASNGKQALQKIKENKPDVMTLDIEMDGMNGLELLETMKNDSFFVPTIMLSKLTQKNGDATIKAFELGAVDFISKPESNFLNIELDKFGQEIYEKITLSTSVTKNSALVSKKNNDVLFFKSSFIIPKILVIGASTGGPTALYEIFSRLPKINIPIIVIQHMPAGFTESLAKRLNDISEIDVKIAENNEVLKPGFAYVAPGDYHLTIGTGGIICLNQDKPYKGVRPSVDISLKSAVQVYGGRILSVILTGMGNDGCEGVEEISNLGGKCIVQNKETCVVFGMPEAVIEDNNADSIVSLSKISEEIIYYLSNWD